MAAAAVVLVGVVVVVLGAAALPIHQCAVEYLASRMCTRWVAQGEIM